MMNHWRPLLLFCVLLLTWFSIKAGLGSHYARQAEQGDEAAIASALGWQPGNPNALLSQALARQEDDPDAAIALLGQAYRANMTAPRPLVALARLLNAREQSEQADALIEWATQLAPTDWRVQSQIASYWMSRERFDRVLPHWSTMLTANPSTHSEVFPIMLMMAESSTLRTLFEPLTKTPPVWWNDFFSYLSQQSTNRETVAYLWALRQQEGHQPLTPAERAAYITRLLREGMIAEAYILWVGGLKDNAQHRLGLLFDGGFEGPLKQGGFGWQLSEHKNFSARPASIKGATGTAALRLHFSGFAGNFQHLWQPLFLEPGFYRLTGQVRPDGLESKGGLRWQVRCLQPAVKGLGDGPRFLGSADWSQFDLNFEVPASCKYQQLILVSAGERAFERKLDGTIWFDNLKITRVQNLDAAARADALLTSQKSRTKQ